MSLIPLLLLSLACKKPVDPVAGGDPAAAEVQAAIDAAAQGQTGTTPTAEAPKGSDTRSQIGQATALLTTKKPEDARAAVDRLKGLLVSEPNNPYIHFNLGVAYEVMGDQTSARDAYLEAVRIQKDFGPAYLNLAAMDMRSGQYDRAASRYRLGISNDPDNMDLWVGLISALQKQGKLTEAEAEAKKALQINSNALNVYNNLGLVYIERGQLDLANFIYQKALTTVPGADASANIHCNLGRIYQLQGKSGDAKQALTKALERDPNLVPALMYLTEYNLANRNFVDTVPLMERARDLDPGNPNIYMNLGVAYRGTARYDEARAAYEQVIKLKPEDPDPHLNLGILYGDYMKNYDAAIAEYELYIKMGGSQSSAVQVYIENTRKEQEKVKKMEERKKRAEEDAKRREAAKAEEERKAREAAAAEAAAAAAAAFGGAQPPVDPAPPTPPPDGGTAPPVPAPEGTTPPATPPTDNPWGG
ncbi:tetratricopeptide repeat protein [Myxococcota bacterium]|nr:tetratricopeptide repeat protein [Myxococcota bacterium]